MSGSLTDCPYDNQIYAPSRYSWASLVVQMVKNLPAMQDRELGQEDALEKGMATHSSVLDWRIPWTYCPWGRKESDRTERPSLSLLSRS